MKKFWTDKFYINLMKLYNHLILGILFYLYSIPIVTIGASSSALYASYREVKIDVFINVKKLFFKKFKENMKESVQLFFLFLLISSAFISLMLFTKIKNIPMLLFPIFFLLSIVLLLNYLNYFNLAINKEIKLKEIIYSSFYLLNSKTLSVISIFVLNIVLILVPIYFPKLGLISVLFMPSLITVLKFKLLKEN